MAINRVTTALNRTYMSFAIHKICTDGQTRYTFSCSHENLLSPTDEVQFMDCKQLFTDCVWVLRSVQSIRIDELYIPYLNMKIFLVPLMRCNFWTGLYMRFAICMIGGVVCRFVLISDWPFSCQCQTSLNTDLHSMQITAVKLTQCVDREVKFKFCFNPGRLNFLTVL